MARSRRRQETAVPEVEGPTSTPQGQDAVIAQLGGTHREAVEADKQQAPAPEATAAAEELLANRYSSVDDLEKGAVYQQARADQLAAENEKLKARDPINEILGNPDKLARLKEALHPGTPAEPEKKTTGVEVPDLPKDDYDPYDLRSPDTATGKWFDAKLAQMREEVKREVLQSVIEPREAEARRKQMVKDFITKNPDYARNPEKIQRLLGRIEQLRKQGLTLEHFAKIVEAEESNDETSAGTPQDSLVAERLAAANALPVGAGGAPGKGTPELSDDAKEMTRVLHTVKTSSGGFDPFE